MNVKKRRFAFGGFSDIDEGRDTPDQALARKASNSKYANDAADKAAGLASTKGQDVGLKRLFMGNIDKPDSEAGQQFGAGRARLDRMPAAPDRSKTMGNRNMEGFDLPKPSPVPVVPPKINVDDRRRAQDYADDVGGPTADREKAQTYADEFGPNVKPVVRPVVRPTVRPNISASDKPMPPVGPMGSTKRGEIPGQASDVKAPASTGQDTSGPSNFGRIASAVGAGAGVLGTAAALRTAGHAGRYAKTAEKTAKTFKDATNANNAKKAAIATSRVTKAKAEAAAKTGGPKGKNPFDAAKKKSPRDRSSFKSADDREPEFRRGGAAKAYASGGSVSSRADGCAQRGKTRGMMR
jgi:hypothetical protein